jgi:glyoxylase-like metal-dependent hydrolase (beta-lactamase superfamily II)
MVTIGDVEVVRIEEFHGPCFLPGELLPDWTDEIVAEHNRWLVPTHFAPSEGRLVLSSHSWVIRTKHHTILIDTCIGNWKERPNSGPLFDKLDLPYMTNFSAAGIRPEDVDFVMCTHLHADHVGWNTQLKDGRWVPTFPNAKYLFSEIDRNAFDPTRGELGKIGDNARVFADSVSPIIRRSAGFRCVPISGTGEGC